MIVAGLGFSAAISSEEIVRLIRLAESQCGKSVDLVAIPQFKSVTAPLRAALAELRLPLHQVSGQKLQDAQPFCPTSSIRALKETGLASIAEACALAAIAGPRHLLLERISSKRATCAIASEVSA